METKEPKKDEVHYWRDQIMPKFLSVSTLLVVVEDSAIREIFQNMFNIDSSDKFDFSIPRATPIVIEFNKSLNPVKSYYILN